MTSNNEKIDFNSLTDEQLLATHQELQAVVEERGLWVEEGAGSLVVAQTVDIEILDIEAEHSRLLGTVEAGARYFNGAVNFINASRRKKDRIPVLEPEEYRERAQDWLTDERVVAAQQLPSSEGRPRLIIPRLQRPITAEETVNSWGESSDYGLFSWSERMKFLGSWTDDRLSGYGPEQDDADCITIIPTAYDEDREGVVAQQAASLEALQTEFPKLDVATIFEGSVIARRYIGQSRSWRDSYVRGITLAPAKVGGFDYVPYALVLDDGGASVSVSNVVGNYAARLRVR